MSDDIKVEADIRSISLVKEGEVFVVYKRHGKTYKFSPEARANLVKELQAAVKKAVENE